MTKTNQDVEFLGWDETSLYFYCPSQKQRITADRLSALDDRPSKSISRGFRFPFFPQLWTRLGKSLCVESEA